MNKIRFLLIIAFLLSIEGCLSGPLPEEVIASPPPITTPPPSLDELTFIPLDLINEVPIDNEISRLILDVEDLEIVPYFNPVDVVSNDLSVLNHPKRLPILASIISKNTFIFIEPEKDTGILIYYTLYELNDSTSATELLDAYRGQWNKREFNSTKGQIWIWDGYLEEIAGQGRPLKKDSILYWNPEGGASFLSEKVLIDHPAITKTDDTLYSVHGETSLNNYFIMIDIKTGLNNIQERTNKLFDLALDKLFVNETISILNETPLQEDKNKTDSQVSPSEEVTRKKLIKLLEAYIEGNITREEYNLLFEEYNSQLTNQTK